MRCVLLLPVLLAGCALEDGSFWDDLVPDLGPGAWPSDGDQDFAPVDHASATFVHMGGYASPVRGVAFRDDDNLWAGLAGWTCRLTIQGTMRDDVDVVPERDDEVTDHGGTDEGPVVTDDEGGTVYVLDPNGHPVLSRNVPGVIVGRSDGHGDVVALVDHPEQGCAVVWHDGDARTIQPIGADLCPSSDGFAVDRDGAIAYAATAAGVVAVGRAGIETFDHARGDLLAWDEGAGQLYIGRVGSHEVSAIAPDGSPLWTADLGDRVVLLRSQRLAGGALAVVARTSESTVVHLDPSTGQATNILDVFERVKGLAVSPYGDALAVTTRAAVDMFRRD